MSAPTMPTLSQFQAWARATRPLAEAVVMAQAAAQVMRACVDAYVEPLFQARTFTVREKWRALGVTIATSADLYLTEENDPAVTEFYAACDAAHRAHGFTGPAGYCPALVAERLVVEAEWALMDAADPLFHIGHPSGADRKKYLEYFAGRMPDDNSGVCTSRDGTRWSMSVRVKAIEVDFVAVEIFVDDDGQFSAMAEGTRCSSTLLVKVEEQIRAAIRQRVRISIPALLLTHDQEISKVTVTGVHASTGNLMLRDEDGGTQQLGWHRHGDVLLQAGADVAEHQRLIKASERVAENLREWVAANTLDKRAAVEEARQRGATTTGQPLTSNRPKGSRA